MIARYWVLNEDGTNTEHRLSADDINDLLQVLFVRKMAGQLGGYEIYDVENEHEMDQSDFLDWEKRQSRTVTSWYDKGALSRSLTRTALQGKKTITHTELSKK